MSALERAARVNDDAIELIEGGTHEALLVVLADITRYLDAPLSLQQRAHIWIVILDSRIRIESLTENPLA